MLDKGVLLMINLYHEFYISRIIFTSPTPDRLRGTTGASTRATLRGNTLPITKN